MIRVYFQRDVLGDLEDLKEPQQCLSFGWVLNGAQVGVKEEIVFSAVSATMFLVQHHQMR